MKKPLLFITLLLFTTTFCSAQGGKMPDWANKSGAFGIGANTSLGGSFGNGVTQMKFGILPLLRFNLTSDISTQIGIGPVKEKYATDDYSFTVSGVSVNVRGQLAVAYFNQVSLNTVLGVNLFNGGWKQESNGFAQEGDEAALEIALGLKAEWFTSQFFEIPTSFGLRFDFISAESSGSSFSDQGDMTLNIFGATDLYGSAGFTFWF